MIRPAPQPKVGHTAQIGPPALRLMIQSDGMMTAYIDAET
jgi:hypothetical protein